MLIQVILGRLNLFYLSPLYSAFGRPLGFLSRFSNQELDFEIFQNFLYFLRIAFIHSVNSQSVFVRLYGIIAPVALCTKLPHRSMYMILGFNRVINSVLQRYSKDLTTFEVHSITAYIILY